MSSDDRPLPVALADTPYSAERGERGVGVRFVDGFNPVLQLLLFYVAHFRLRLRTQSLQRSAHGQACQYLFCENNEL